MTVYKPLVFVVLLCNVGLFVYHKQYRWKQKQQTLVKSFAVCTRKARCIYNLGFFFTHPWTLSGINIAPLRLTVVGLKQARALDLTAVALAQFSARELVAASGQVLTVPYLLRRWCPVRLGVPWYIWCLQLVGVVCFDDTRYCQRTVRCTIVCRLRRLHLLFRIASLYYSRVRCVPCSSSRAFHG